MALESVAIQTTLDGSGLTAGYREDLSEGDVVVASLTSSTGVTTRAWTLVGRPEFSTAGGGGPNPWSLGTGATATFTVDSDAAYKVDGAYVVECIINAGLPDQARKRVALVRTTGLTITGPSGPVALRRLGMFETFEDTSVEGLLAGWATQVNRWLEFLRQLSV